MEKTIFSFSNRLNGSEAFERLGKLQAIWALLELVGSYFECINNWHTWRYIQFIVSIPLFTLMASVVVQRINDIGWPGYFGARGAVILFFANTFFLIFGDHSPPLNILFAVVLISMAGALYILPSEQNTNKFGDVPDGQLNMPVVLVTIAAIASFITAGFSIECNAPAPYEPPPPQPQIQLPSIYPSCLACCDAKGYFANCGCDHLGNGFQCFGG